MYLLRCGAFSFLSDDQAGEWDGMVAELVNKKADIALGSLRVLKNDSKKYEKRASVIFSQQHVTISTA